MTSQTGAQVGDKYLLPTGKDDAARLDIIHAVYGPISFKGLEVARSAAEGGISFDRRMELMSGMEKHTANPDVWVAVAKMFAVIGRKEL